METAKQVDAAISDVQKSYKDERIVFRMGDQTRIKIDAIPSGITSLDAILGCGGFPRGRIIEIYGGESSAKTTVCLRVIAEAQKAKGQVLYVPTESDINPDWMEKAGVDTDSLAVCLPDCGEQAMEVVERFVQEGTDLVVVDSVEGLVPKAEMEGEMGEAVMGVKARLISQACRKLSSIVSKSNTVLIFTNQIREKIGITYGSPETTPGGRALKFWSSIRLDLRSREKIKEGDKIVGATIHAKVVKNKVGPPFLQTTFDVYGGSCPCHAAGVDVWGNLLEFAVEKKVIERSGAWYEMGAEKIGHGHVAASKTLFENLKLAQQVRQAIEKACQPIREEKGK